MSIQIGELKRLLKHKKITIEEYNALIKVATVTPTKKMPKIEYKTLSGKSIYPRLPFPNSKGEPFSEAMNELQDVFYSILVEIAKKYKERK